MRNDRLFFVCILLLAGCAAPPPPNAVFSAQTAAQATVAPADFGALHWREVGPAVMGGRLDAVAGVPGDPNVIYLAHSSGGLYKSIDGGMTFEPIFDAGRSTSIGAIAVAPSNANVLYAGTGEGFPRNTAALGDGVFRSDDAGKTWRSCGLTGTQHIAKIAIDPTNPNVALVAAMGPEFTPGGERGIYRTSDGGRTWQRVLYVNPTTGGSDVAFDPSNPQIALAGTFDYLRRPWTFRGGGVGSGLFRSTDGGVTWTKLTDPARHDGLPGGIINRVGLSISAHHPNVVYAIVPTRTGMLYRSDDGGVQWRLVNADQDLVFRPFYFSQVRVDPDRPNIVWNISGELSRSTDGGKHFKGVEAGGDNHDLWIDPSNPRRELLGSDMGFDLSNDDGKTWSFVNTVPFAQVYRVGYDHALPYHVMGGMQDHEVWWGPNSLWNDTGVAGGSWRNISDWGDGQYAVPDPTDSDVIYEDTHFGDLTRRNLLTGEARYISPQPKITFGTGAGSSKYRFNWSAPLLVSRHDPDTIYYGGNVLFRSRDQGQSWSVISPDLTQPCDPKWLLPSGGPITHDNTNAETYCTIFAIAEGMDAGTIWVGTDDGHVDVTHDSGASWTDVGKNITGVPAHAIVASIETSHQDPDVAYVTFDAHRLGDTHPYIYMTHDGGTSWTRIDSGLPLWAYVVREDPRARNLLFAGTEDGLYVSFDRGAHWQDFRLGMNHVPVFDLQIQPEWNDLIAGTHGRGFAILDDITPLEGLARAVQGEVALFRPRTAWRYTARPYHDLGQNEFVSENKPYGAVISYYLKPHRVSKPAKKTKENVTIEILDAHGAVIRHLDGTADGGVNRVTWDLTTDAPGWPKTVQDSRPYYVFYPLAITGPQVLPGRYTVRLLARGATLEVPLTVRLDPRVKASVAALQAQYDALERLAQDQERGEVWLARLKKGKGPRYTALADRLRNGNGSENAGYKQPARVIDQIAYLRHIIATAYDGSTDVQAALIQQYERQLDAIGKGVNALPSPMPATASPRPARR
ncbi:MAG TPA: hypothetical protein VMF11_02485 [Candidatus Baltobacteraceae bacterium]|nr:hypothetical protein [Candidatus Baltobacteraceae bacterium]